MKTIKIGMIMMATGGACGAAALETITPDAGEFAALRAETTACAQNLSDTRRWTPVIPADCARFIGKDSGLLRSDDRELLKERKIHYELPPRKSFLQEEMNKLEVRERDGRNAIILGGVVGMMGALVCMAVRNGGTGSSDVVVESSVESYREAQNMWPQLSIRRQASNRV